MDIDDYVPDGDMLPPLPDFKDVIIEGLLAQLDIAENALNIIWDKYIKIDSTLRSEPSVNITNAGTLAYIAADAITKLRDMREEAE